MTHGEAVSRSDPRHYTPRRLPREVQELLIPDRVEEEVPQLEVGRAGKVGLLELVLEPHQGKTRISHHFHKVPLQVLEVIYPDDQTPGMAFVYIMSPSGGILQGDRYRLDITARAGSRVHITTQAATKIYRMERNYASQVFNLEVGANAYVEYLPDPTIPFRDARFYQETSLVVHRTGTLIYSEVILPGRVARGEVHAYRLYYNRTEAADEQGRLLFVDTVRLRPQTIPVQTPGLLGAFDVLGTMYVVTPLAEPGALAHQLHERLQGREALMAAASELPGGAGVIVRVLGQTSQGVASALRNVWEHVRMRILGVGPPSLRKY